MDPIKFNPFQGVTGAQRIDPLTSQPSQSPTPEEAPPALEIEVTPDEEGAIDISGMTLDFEDKLKNLQ